ncbi:MAG: hypothetical protein JRI25_13340, partial [Deltaproteobacteria bacterium]|nr:hypothetical protein [Deltaproteobacteria bacterium]
MQRFRIGATVAILALLISQPSLGTPPLQDTSTYLYTAESELLALEALTREVRSPRLRQQIRTHARNARYAVDRARTDSRYGSDRGNQYGNGSRHGYRSRHQYGSGYSYTPYTDPRHGGSYGYNGLSYQDAREILGRESFDSGRMDAIERIARKGRFTTEEAR